MMEAFGDGSEPASHSQSGPEDCVFRVEMKNFKLSNLKTDSLHQDREKLRINALFDNILVRSEFQVVWGSELAWKFKNIFEYKIFSWRVLDEVFLKLQLWCPHSASPIGELQVDVHTLATGPEFHDLPVRDKRGREIGRLSFTVVMHQICHITAAFQEIAITGLSKPTTCYVKYIYSKDWVKELSNPLLFTKKGVYSKTICSKNPIFSDLNSLSFKSCLQELKKEYISVHLTCPTPVSKTSLGRCRLLFRSLLEGGTTNFKENMLVSFRGHLKAGQITISGTLYLRNLPKFAQMKSTPGGTAVHTENGIFFAEPFLPNFLLPNMEVLKLDDADGPKPREQTSSKSDASQERSEKERLIKPEESKKQLSSHYNPFTAERDLIRWSPQHREKSSFVPGDASTSSPWRYSE